MKKKGSKFPNIEAEMQKKGDNQVTIAKLLGTTQPTICRKLSGEIGWSLEEVKKICKYFNKEFSELFL